MVGPVEDTARFLEQILASVRAAGADDEEALRVAAGDLVSKRLEEGRRIPGLGHPIHTVSDPRTRRLYELAEATGQVGDHLSLLLIVAEAYSERTGRALPINEAGAAGAALADLGFPPFLARGFALLARTAGLIAHLGEEAAQPIGMRLWKELDERASTLPSGPPVGL